MMLEFLKSCKNSVERVQNVLKIFQVSGVVHVQRYLVHVYGVTRLQHRKNNNIQILNILKILS